jgi:arginine deiminase
MPIKRFTPVLCFRVMCIFASQKNKNAMNTHNQANINSEIGKLEGVILHTPGSEVENMTPANAERALYSDILNLHIAKPEYLQLSGVLEKVSTVYQVKKILTEILPNPAAKAFLLKDICQGKEDCTLFDELNSIPDETLASQLIEGVPLRRDNLSRFLSQERYELRPLHNFFFTRDSAMVIGKEVLIGNMASPVRKRETQIMEAIFKFHPLLKSPTINPDKGTNNTKDLTIEGGDIQIVTDEILLAGAGLRTSTKGIDFLVDHFKKTRQTQNILVQELPKKPESFIHLDMVFTNLNHDECLVYEPLISKQTKHQTILISIHKGRVSINQVKNLPDGLRKLGMDIKTISCGGTGDPYIQEREQWHSGANFFTFAPGKAIGYNRNVYTLEELNKHGYEILPAEDVISGKTNPDHFDKCIITIDGAELARGGGGARCMTMPVRRQ